jgi:hypothetical protein
MLNDLISFQRPPANRVRSCEGEDEHHFSEGAVMIAFAMHLLRTVPGLMSVDIHPDGEHGKRFDFRGWLEKRDFVRSKPLGATKYGGEYRNAAGQSVVIDPRSGCGDVAAELGGKRFVAECKGGVINTKHPGQLSRLRRGLCEAVGLSLSSEVELGKRQFAVVPKTPTTDKLARQMIGRAKAAGIEIALVDGTGNVFDVT